MVRNIKALFSGGALIPQGPCDLPVGAVVDLVVEGVSTSPPSVVDPGRRNEILNALVGRMRQNRLPIDAPRWRRDELHERG